MRVTLTFNGLIKNVLRSLAKSVLIWLGLTPEASESDEAIPKKKTIGSGMTSLIISTKEVEDIMKIVKFPEEYVSFIKCIG